MGKTDITKDVADKVVEQIGPQIDKKFQDFETSFDKKFQDINDKLAADKELLTMHTNQLNAHESRVGKLESDTNALCHGMLALLEKDEKHVAAYNAMKNYLIDGVYREEKAE